MQRRRRRIALLVLILVFAMAGVLFSKVLTSSRTAPKSAVAVPVHYWVGIARCTFFDSARSTLNYLNNTTKKGRLLITEVRYPTLSPTKGLSETPDAHPALRHGPFPMVVFGHGYALTPDTYAKLLDHWVEAGFVVVAPLFPDTSEGSVANISVANSFLPEADDINQPGDMAFVTKEMLNSSGATSLLCPIAHGLISRTKIALAGQSDGATTAVALGYGLVAIPGGHRSLGRAVWRRNADPGCAFGDATLTGSVCLSERHRYLQSAAILARDLQRRAHESQVVPEDRGGTSSAAIYRNRGARVQCGGDDDHDVPKGRVRWSCTRTGAFEARKRAPERCLALDRP